MKNLFIFRLIIISLVLCGGYTAADEMDKISPHNPTLIASLKLDGPIDFCGETVPMENPEVKERFEKEFMLSVWDRPQVMLWLKRSSRYMPIIEEGLSKAGMPDDLKYVAIAESALRPHAGSKKGAIGFWQFMAATGRKYGLTIDRFKDERRNIYASTTAAIEYLKMLHNDFHSWALAAAAYNMGEEGLTAEIMEQNTNDYYKLYLPLETQRYLFRILSAKLILSNPEKYGFHLTDKDYYPPLASDLVEISCSQGTPIRIIAMASDTHFKRIKDLNPEIRGHYLKKGTHEIRIPKGQSQGFQTRFEELEEKYQTAKSKKVYIVKKGDNLSSIAERFGIPLAAIIIWNRIDMRKPIHPGDRLIVFGQEKTDDEMDE